MRQAARSLSTGKLPERRTTGPAVFYCHQRRRRAAGQPPSVHDHRILPGEQRRKSSASKIGAPPLRLALVAVSPCPSAASSRRSPSWPGTRTARVCPCRGRNDAAARPGQRPRPTSRKGLQYRKAGSIPKSASCPRSATTTGSALSAAAPLDPIDRLDAAPVPRIGRQAIARLGRNGEDAAARQQRPQRLHRIAEVPDHEPKLTSESPARTP